MQPFHGEIAQSIKIGFLARIHPLKRPVQEIIIDEKGGAWNALDGLLYSMGREKEVYKDPRTKFTLEWIFEEDEFEEDEGLTVGFKWVNFVTGEEAEVYHFLCPPMDEALEEILFFPPDQRKEWEEFLRPTGEPAEVE